MSCCPLTPGDVVRDRPGPSCDDSVEKADCNCSERVCAADAAAAVGAAARQRVGGDAGDQDDGDDEECNGGDPMFSTSQRIWGYETPDGSFAQFCKVQARQLMKRPQHLTWEESASYTLTLATAYRMLFGHRPHILRPGHNVLVWGAAGGRGVSSLEAESP